MLSKLSKGASAYIFVLPALLIYALFIIYPLGDTFRLSLVEWDGISPVRRYVGLSNYIKLLHDPLALLSLKHNLIWTIGTTIFVVGLALLSAVLLWSGVRGMIGFRTIYFMPSILPYVTVGIIWVWIYNPIFGFVNGVLRSMGLGVLARGWLGNPDTALGALIFTKIWEGFGWSMVIFLAGLQGLDMELLDAAKVDGANAWQRFLYVILPQLRHVTTVVTLIAIITGFGVFDLIFVTTRGGPAYHTEVMSTYIYTNAFKYNRVGYGAALTALLLFISLFFSILFIRVRERGEE